MKKISLFLVLICAAVAMWAQTAEEVKQVRTAAERGDTEAQLQLGYCYANGLGGLSLNATEAVKWFRKSADKGFAPAQCVLGGCYENGVEGVIAVDFYEAVKWYRKSAEQGFAEAQCNLGNAYASGAGGLTQSNDEAIKWWKKSAEQNFFQAQFYLGYYYKSQNNTTTSLYWFEKALSNAKENRKTVPQEMKTEFDKNYIQPVEKEISELKTPTPKTASYLSTSTTDVSFTASGGTKTITVSTDGSSYDVAYLPTWCSVSKSNGYFTLSCEGNTGDARADWFKVKSDSKEVRIDVSQSAGVKQPSAKIENIWVEHNFLCGYNRKCLKIHIKFSTDEMLYKQGSCNAYFSFQNGNKLIDYNGLYKATDGQVSVGESFKPPYESTVYNDFALVIPHDEFHLGRGSYYLKFYVGIFDNNGNQIATSNYVDFTYNY
jgi:tetratricopeptide (TPR) repeat protein